jgi:hypothetical protein
MIDIQSDKVALRGIGTGFQSPYWQGFPGDGRRVYLGVCSGSDEDAKQVNIDQHACNPMN